MNDPSGSRNMLPASASASSSNPATSPGSISRALAGSSEPRQKRAQISVACEVCRRRKAKCDGMRPTCTPCQNRRLDCHYVADPDTTRMATLKRKHQALNDRNVALESFIAFLRDAPQTDALSTIDRLRTGSSVEDIVRTATGMRLPADTPLDRTDLEQTPPGEQLSIMVSNDSELSRSQSVGSVRDRMAVNALLAAGSSSEDANSDGSAPIPVRARAVSPMNNYNRAPQP